MRCPICERVIFYYPSRFGTHHSFGSFSCGFCKVKFYYYYILFLDQNHGLRRVEEAYLKD